MNLNDKALLVQLNISQWTGRKFDKRATQEIAANHGTTEKAGRYNKVLLPANDLLANVHKKSTVIRTEYYRNTLPWATDGSQLLPTSNYLAFMQQFRQHKADWEQLVEQFIDAYTDLKAEAQQILGSLYNESDYPSVDEIRRKFDIDMVVMPVPSNDFRVEVADAELQRIQQDVEARVQDASERAMQDVWKRLYDRVEHMAEKLADPKAIFRDSMIENAREICSLLPRLNFSDNPDLEQMRNEVEQKLACHHPDALRNDPDLRRDTAAEANQILSAMGAFMGGAK